MSKSQYNICVFFIIIIFIYLLIRNIYFHDTRLERDLHKLFIVDIRETQINIQSTILKYSVRITYLKL